MTDRLQNWHKLRQGWYLIPKIWQVKICHLADQLYMCNLGNPIKNCKNTWLPVVIRGCAGDTMINSNFPSCDCWVHAALYVQLINRHCCPQSHRDDCHHSLPMGAVIQGRPAQDYAQRLHEGHGVSQAQQLLVLREASRAPFLDRPWTAEVLPVGATVLCQRSLKQVNESTCKIEGNFSGHHTCN